MQKAPFLPDRRFALKALFAFPLLLSAPTAHAEDLTFDELYNKGTTVLSERALALDGTRVEIVGFMAPPLKAEAAFFVLTEIPMAICPFCSSDSDWPDNILVVYLDEKQTFVQSGQTIEVSGTLEFGSWTDPETGFVSQLRLRSASFSLT